jgi:DNA invertase Pin-like site-specific DNA recombinase
MPSIVNVSGERVEIAQATDWPDEEIDRVIGRLVVGLQAQGVGIPRIAARFRVHRATVYRWIAQIPEHERRRLGVG